MRQRMITMAFRILDDAAMLALLLVFLLSAFSVFDSVRIWESAAQPGLRQARSAKDSSAPPAEALPGSVGWLTVKDTQIDFPVMQGPDNRTYLNRDPYGRYSLAGSIFLDAANSPDFSDGYSLIYGHHMEMGRMFGALDRYRAKDYFSGHRDGTLTAGDRVFRIRFFAVAEAEADCRTLFSVEDTDPAAVRAFFQSRSIFTFSYEPNLPLIALSTCVNAGSSRRLLLAGTLMEEGTAASG